MPHEIERHGADRLGHVIFVVTLVGKGMLGAAQLAASAAIVLGLAQHLPAIAQWLVGNALIEDPDDVIANLIMSLPGLMPADQMNFYALYFLLHGLLHLGVMVALLAGWLWAYPAAIATLVVFIVIQMAEWLQVGGPMLLALTALDLLVIYLTLREWHQRRAISTRKTSTMRSPSR